MKNFERTLNRLKSDQRSGKCDYKIKLKSLYELANANGYTISYFKTNGFKYKYSCKLALHKIDDQPRRYDCKSVIFSAEFLLSGYGINSAIDMMIKYLNGEKR